MHARTGACVCLSIISDYMQHIPALCENSKMFQKLSTGQGA